MPRAQPLVGTKTGFYSSLLYDLLGNPIESWDKYWQPLPASMGPVPKVVAAFLTPEDWTNVVLSARSATRQIPVAGIGGGFMGHGGSGLSPLSLPSENLTSDGMRTLQVTE